MPCIGPAAEAVYIPQLLALVLPTAATHMGLLHINGAHVEEAVAFKRLPALFLRKLFSRRHRRLKVQNVLHKLPAPFNMPLSAPASTVYPAGG